MSVLLNLPRHSAKRTSCARPDDFSRQEEQTLYLTRAMQKAKGQFKGKFKGKQGNDYEKGKRGNEAILSFRIYDDIEM